MSEAVAAVVEPVVETPAATPVPLGQVESLADYRTRRDAGESGEPVEEPAKEPAKAAETLDPDPASAAGKELAAKRGSLQARIDELTREKHQGVTEATAARAEAAALRAEIAALRGGKPASEPVQSAPVADPNDPEPQVEQFDDYQKYVKAAARWEARQIVKAERAAEQGARQVQGIAEAQTRVEAAAKAAHADFDETIGAFVQGGGVYSDPARGVILNHPLGHEVAYVLAKDPALNARIGSVHPAVALLELGKVIAGLEAAAKPAPKVDPKPAPVSSAPAPVVPVTGEAPAGSFDPEKSNSIAEFRKNRDKF